MATFGIQRMILKPATNVKAPTGIDSEPPSPVQKQPMQQEPNKKNLKYFKIKMTKF